MTIGDLLANKQFSEKYILQKLIMEYMKCTREEMWIEGNKEIPIEIEQKIFRGYELYTKQDMPLEYILGHVTFFDHEFEVNQDTLVPRPETEYMVQSVSEYIQNIRGNKQNLVLMDIGTGCGVLGISVLLQHKDQISTVFFTDISDKALLVAKKNKDTLLKGYSQEMIFVWTDLLSFVDNYQEIWQEKPIILVANLPYIPEQMFMENSPANVQKWEPKMAFVGGEDGLMYYRKLLDQVPQEMKKTIVCFFEMMTRQVEILTKEYQKNRCFEEVKTFHFNIRIIKATYKV